MREFLRGWKRKVGVCTLVMACVFVAGWVRSMSCSDSVRIRCGRFCDEQLSSYDGQLLWDHQIINFRRSMSGVSWPRVSWNVYSFNALGNLDRENITFEIKSLRSGVALYSAKISQAGKIVSVPSNCVVFAPYWSIVIPLTLLSGWLLLSKPRASKAKPISEPE